MGTYTGYKGQLGVKEVRDIYYYLPFRTSDIKSDITGTFCPCPKVVPYNVSALHVSVFVGSVPPNPIINAQ